MASPPLPPRPAAASRRLAASLAVSLALHLLVLADLRPPPRPPSAGTQALQIRLAIAAAPATLPPLAPPAAATAPQEPPAPAAAAPTGQLPSAGSAAREPQGPRLTEAARFAAPPDLAGLDEIALSQPLRLKLRIHVNALGRAERIDVLETRLVPSAFLAGVSARLEDARYLPGRADGIAVDSSFEMVIEAAPGLEMAQPSEPVPAPRQRQPPQ